MMAKGMKMVTAPMKTALKIWWCCSSKIGL